MIFNCSMIDPEPAVRDDDRQGIGIFRADMDEVNFQTIDVGHELRNGV